MVPVSSTTAIRATLVALAVGAAAAAIAMAVLSHAHAAQAACKPNAAVIADKRTESRLSLTSPCHINMEVAPGTEPRQLRKPTGTAAEPRIASVPGTEVEHAGSVLDEAIESSRPILLGRDIEAPGAARTVIDSVDKITEAIELAVGHCCGRAPTTNPPSCVTPLGRSAAYPVPGTHLPARTAAPDIAPVQPSPTPTVMPGVPATG